MSRRFVSENARRIGRIFRNVRAHILAAYSVGMDLDTQEVYNNALMQVVEELDGLLRQQSVRGHMDPSILSPNVNIRSATLRIVCRLEKQINAVCILADIAELGPAANADEARVITRAEQLIEQLHETSCSGIVATWFGY